MPSPLAIDHAACSSTATWGQYMEYVILIFLLFFAVLAFGWFYLQRAKARDAGTAATTTTEPSAPASSDATVTTPADERQP
jgi:hypothetical protein